MTLWHSAWGIEGDKLATSTVTNIASSGTCRSCRTIDNVVESQR